jgi:GNAT superfamily N-acetyltransferase
MRVSASSDFRTQFRPGDLGAVVELHGREYGGPYGLDPTFEAGVARTVAEFAVACARDPEAGRIWLADDEQGLTGCIAITREGERHGRVRWFLVASRARGQRLGRRLFDEAMDYARERFDTLELDTFSELTTAARMYKSVGFVVTDERAHSGWGREVQLQRYELRLD